MPMLKFLFVFVTEQLSLFDNFVYNYMAMAIIGVIAFNVAFKMVGDLYRSDIISGSSIGSLLHWIIRIIVFVLLVLLVSLAIWLVKLIIAVPAWIWFALLAIGVIALIIYIVKNKQVNNFQN